MNPFSTKKKTGPYRIIKNQESNFDDEDDMVLLIISEIHNQSSESSPYRTTVIDDGVIRELLCWPWSRFYFKFPGKEYLC